MKRSRVISFRVEEEVYRELLERAQEEGVTVSELARRLILEALGKQVVDGTSTYNINEIVERLEELELKMKRLEEAVKKALGMRWFLSR